MIDGERAQNADRSPNPDLVPTHRGTPMPDYVNAWVSTQRWFGNKGRMPALRSIGHFPLPSAEAGVSIRVDLVLDTASLGLTLYQLPTTERVGELPGATNALITVRKPGSDHARFIYDAAYDPAFAAALLAFMERQGVSSTTTAPSTDRSAANARGEDLRPGSAATSTDLVASSRVLSGEQSNTSIIVQRVDATGAPTTPIICKVFRIIHAGENPDVTVQAALANAGSGRIPLPFGAVLGQWDDPAEPGSRAVGHLAFAQEFLPGAPDAWRTALVAAASGSDFTGPSFRLGQATAEVHQDLGRALPTLDATPAVIAEEMAKMRLRCSLTLREVPVLARHRDAIEAVFARAETAAWPRLQRIHGDFHLGQVLDVQGRGWVLLDFEGEPLRTLRERTRPDIPLRDVAGMLRSFSYVSGAMMATAGPTADTLPSISDWAAACRRAFLDGYAERSGIELADQSALLDAFELDKALYEAVYETRNRPTWLPIPLAAIERLVGGSR
ncbi:MAG: phosphotransferase [Cryobacterium sp.]|uniref:maltokinase N-terminal cap-like domain-containing protein n=1 Tax=unclassified Cryobacterium TaxID=2649013 RepID=UPI0018CB18A0|nr:MULTISPECIES: phosphotransferase [unclassified Cryobacterium]MCY7405600.1 phosphotransferase [Cryobacterium sp.]MEC5154372.1 maltokinase [Cryobacterium sp. CAN_C3]